jgi:plastocyanin
MKTHTLQLLLCSVMALALGACGKSGAPAETAAPPTPEPFTGTVHEMKMVGTATAFHFEPGELTIKRGDKVRFTLVSAGPHNVNFANQQIPAGASMLLESQGKLTGALLQAPGQTYEVWFTEDMPTGEYNFVCDPHTAFKMKGKITVTP